MEAANWVARDHFGPVSHSSANLCAPFMTVTRPDPPKPRACRGNSASVKLRDPVRPLTIAPPLWFAVQKGRQ